MLSTSDIIIRLVLGAVLGGIIGFERQSHGRPAGFRTHLIVCLASVLIMIVSEQYYHLFSLNPDFIRIDPARIAAGAITGVGFLGAGVIIKSGFTIQGLTTAACLWVVSAVGLSIGAGLFIPALVSTIITVLALWSLRGVERNMSRLLYKHLTIVTGKPDHDEDIRRTIKETKAYISNVDYEIDNLTQETRLHMTISIGEKADLKDLMSKLSLIEGVKKISIKG